MCCTIYNQDSGLFVYTSCILNINSCFPSASSAGDELGIVVFEISASLVRIILVTLWIVVAWHIRMHMRVW